MRQDDELTEPSKTEVLNKGGFKPTLHLTPLPTPRVDSQLTQLNVPERAAEVCRYSILRMEYWLSPGGLLREVLRRTLLLTLLLGIPTLLLTPIITVLISCAATWSALLLEIVHNVAMAFEWAIKAVLYLAGLTLLLQFLARKRS